MSFCLVCGCCTHECECEEGPVLTWAEAVKVQKEVQNAD